MLASSAVRHPRTARAFIAALLATLLIAITFGWQALIEAEQTQTKARLQLESDSLARLIETRFEDQMGTLHRLASRWEYQRDRPELWDRDVRALLQDYQNFQAIEWLDERYHMRWVEPLEGNEHILGFVYRPDHPNYALLAQARESGGPVLSHTFELQQGGKGLAHYVPLYKRAEDQAVFDGFLIGIFKVEVLVSSLLTDLSANQLSLRFKSAGVPVYERLTADTLADTWTVESRVTLDGNSEFAIVAYPTRYLLKNSTTNLPLMVLVSGVLAALSLSYALFLALVSSQRLAALRSSNSALQTEVAKRQATESILQKNQARLQLILDLTDHSHDALFILAFEPQELVYMNKTCWSGLGYSEQELRTALAADPRVIMPDAITWSESLKSASRRGRGGVFQRIVKQRNGNEVPLEVSAKYIERDGRHYMICVARNNREQLMAAAQLEQLSNQDALTGLYNRRYFDHTLNNEWRTLRMMEQPLGLLMIDVDHFKAYNDTLGHQAGDTALRLLAKAMADDLGQEEASVCRYGGEEFAVILPGADIVRCVRLAERLHDAVQGLAIDHLGSPTKRITISIGAAALTPAAEWIPQDLLKMADRALYRAKLEGRNQTGTLS